MNTTQVFAEITKATQNEDGTFTVFGKATGPDLDLDKQICDADWLKGAVPSWFSSGANVREQHSALAAGVGTQLIADGENWMLESLVVDASSCKKLEHGVLKGYSIGIRNPQVVKDAAAPGGRIVGGQIVEVSLVDRPANPTCTLMLAKMAGDDLAPVEELIEKAEGEEDPAAEAEEENLIGLVRDGLNRLLAGEAAELVDGGRAQGAINALLTCLNDLDWYEQVDAYEDTENAMNLSALADLCKIASTPEATEDDKAQLDAIKAALGLDKTASITAVTEATTASEERIKALEARLVKVEQMPEPGGPSRLAPAADAAKAALADRTAHEVSRLRGLSKSVSDRSQSLAYEQLAQQLERENAST